MQHFYLYCSLPLLQELRWVSLQLQIQQHLNVQVCCIRNAEPEVTQLIQASASAQWLVHILMNENSPEHFLLKNLNSLQLKISSAGYPFSLINFFNSARNPTADSSSAGVASSVICTFFSPCLFLNLCNYPCAVVSGSVSPVSRDTLLKSSEKCFPV